ncbi:hypothetical protein BDW71DRAFT_213552 [Aspergillus fruticulosus]
MQPIIDMSSIESLTGSQIAKTIPATRSFAKGIKQITGLTLYPNSDACAELKEEYGRPQGRIGITAERIIATKKAGIPNVCFVSSAGCDLAEHEAQPLLRTVVIDLDAMVLEAKGGASTETGHSLVAICRGFYAEHLLYSRQAQEEGKLPLHIGISHKLAPMALSDIAEVVAHFLTGHGKHGFSDKHRGQFMILTGPQLTAGDELATAASQALGKGLESEDISEYAHAPFVHTGRCRSSEGEVAYLLEYYALTAAFHDVTGKHPVEPTEFLKQYAEKVRPKANKKRKTQ